MVRLCVLAVALLLASGCRQDMHDQAKLEPYEASSVFADGSSSRQPPAHVVARGELDNTSTMVTGTDGQGGWATELPLTLDEALLDRGRQRFEIYCSPCHDRTGSGRGMIVQRGFKEPPSYHEDRLKEIPIGYFFDVITNGYGLMSGYAAQVKPADRWAIAAWIRVLQHSQAVPMEQLPAVDREQVLEAAAQTGEAHADEGAHAGAGL